MVGQVDANNRLQRTDTSLKPNVDLRLLWRGYWFSALGSWLKKLTSVHAMADVEQSLEIKPEFDLTSPVDVTFIPGEKAEPAPGIALCLSGGGYRAMTFHLGALWRLNELGYLPKLNRVSSVSGGSITAGVLGVAWGRLAFNLDGVAQYFQQEVAEPIRQMARRTITGRRSSEAC